MRLKPGTLPDFVVVGSVLPNLGWSNIARELWLDAQLDPRVPAWSLVLACASSITATIAASGMLKEGVRDLGLVGGVESMSRAQIGIDQKFSDWLRQFLQARSFGARIGALTELRLTKIRLHVPAVVNRTTGRSMGEHTEEMAREWRISRSAQGARDLSQCVKELFAMPAGSRAVVSVCADGGEGVVTLLERP